MAEDAPVFRPDATVCVNCRSYRALDPTRGQCTNPDAQTPVFENGERIWLATQPGESCLLWQPSERRR